MGLRIVTGLMSPVLVMYAVTSTIMLVNLSPGFIYEKHFVKGGETR